MKRLCAVALLSATACQPTAHPTAAAARPTATPIAATRATPTPAGTSEPTSAPTATPTAIASATAAGTNALLARPTGTQLVSGTLKLDASFIVAQGGGNIVAQGGGNVLTANASGIVAQGGGNAIIADDQGGLLANDTLISQDGGSIVAQGGGNIVAQGGGNYRLMDAAAPKPGEQLPAAGVEIRAYSLLDGKQIALGQDAKGQPVHAIYTDAHGGYQLYLPPDVAAQARLVASLPGTKLQYAALTKLSGTTGASFDEANAMLTRFMILGYAAKFDLLLDAKTEADARQVFSLNDKFPIPAAVIADVLKVSQGFRDAGGDTWARERRAKLLSNITAYLLSEVKDADSYAPIYDDDADGNLLKSQEQEPNAKAVTLAVFRAITAAVSDRIAAEPDGAAFLDKQPPVEAFRKLYDPDFHLRYASDFDVFLARAYLANNQLSPDSFKYKGIGSLLNGEVADTRTIPTQAGLFASAEQFKAMGLVLPAHTSLRLSTGVRGLNLSLASVMFDDTSRAAALAHIHDLIAGS